MNQQEMIDSEFMAELDFTVMKYKDKITLSKIVGSLEFMKTRYLMEAMPEIKLINHLHKEDVLTLAKENLPDNISVEDLEELFERMTGKKPDKHLTEGLKRRKK